MEVVVIDVLSVLLPLVVTPPQPTPVLNGPGASILAVVGGWIAGLVLAAAVVVVIVGAALIVFGHLSNAPDSKTLGWKVVAGAMLGVIVAGSAAVLIHTASGFTIF